MKRFLIILVILLAGLCSFAQEGPKELTFLNTRFVDGASKEVLYSRGRDWQHYRDKKDNAENSAIYDSEKPVVYHHLVRKCPNFGVSALLGGEETGISFDLKIYCRSESYTAEISQINVWYNPDLGILYGENGTLYENLYNKKQMKMGKQIVAFLFDYTDEIFKEIYGFMSGEKQQLF